jgi:hypothetical protein
VPGLPRRRDAQIQRGSHGAHRYDAGKKIKGKKRHILVDTVKSRTIGPDHRGIAGGAANRTLAPL